MTIFNMTIILKLSKYDNLQYDNYFEKIVIFEFLNMTKKNLWLVLLQHDNVYWKPFEESATHLYEAPI